MTEGLIARKVGMTRVFNEDGRATAVTVLQAGPCQVTEVRTNDRDGYEAIQLGFGEDKPARLAKPQRVELETNKLTPTKTRMEFRGMPERELGDIVDVSIFEIGEKVKVRSRTKGRGFAGVVKRHGFRGGPASHGASKFHRAPGSHGNRMTPGFVFKGTRQSGHMGNAYRTTKGLAIVKIDAERNLLFVTGSISGPNGGLVKVTKS